ncbi:hypothetical protein RB600_008803 [Gaeumannomyces tritici]
MNTPKTPANGSNAEEADAVQKHHEAILIQLRLGTEVSEKILSERDTFELDAGQKSILQKVVTEIADPESALSYNAAAKSLITWLLEKEPALLSDGTETGGNVLDLIVDSDQDCMELLEQLCKEGLDKAAIAVTLGTEGHAGIAHSDLEAPIATISLAVAPSCVFEQDVQEPFMWKHLLEGGQDTWLHKAIKLRRTNYAKYLIERVKLNGAAKLVLSHHGQDKLTPLHVAVSSEFLTPNQHELVEELIEAYPDALVSGTRFEEEVEAEPPHARKPLHSHYSRRGIDKAFRRKGLSSSPFQHFLETRAREAVQADPQNRARGALNRRTRTKPATKANAGELKDVAEAVESLLKLSCMRYFGDRREIIKELLPSNVGQIHFDLNPRREVSKDLLEALAGITHFEDTLQYVSIPDLRVIGMELPIDPNEGAQGWWSSNRKDYVYIFDWLRSKAIGVKRILKIVVEDDDHNFHSDEAIEFALRGFKVESWNWMRSDMCSQVIKEAAPGVRDVTLYWSGNNAILRSWAAEGGLPQLEQLRTVTIIRQRVRNDKSRQGLGEDSSGSGVDLRQTIESVQRTEENIKNFKDGFDKAWKKVSNHARPPPSVDFRSDQTKKVVAKALAEAERAGRERKEKWLNCMESFANFLKVYFRNNKLEETCEIKVAVLDDGVNIDHPDVRNNIVEGETFYNNNGHWQGFYQSSHGHGTLMASIICQICPKVKLYVAKLNEEWVNSAEQITADSAAAAIEWAVSKGVDIISMSWSIESPGEGENALRDAMEAAAKDNILLFCASDDQGNKSTEQPYPARLARNSSFYIGAATAWGREDSAVHNLVNYIAPGVESVKELATAARVPAGATPELLMGSSIATARIAGLAAVILQSVSATKGAARKDRLRTHTQIKRILDFLAKPTKYLHVWRIFDEPSKPRAHLADAETVILNAVASKLINIAELGLS